MTETIATWICLGVGVYMLTGVAVTMVFLAGGLKAFDATAAASPWRFKLLVAPGMVALWPVLVARFAGWTPPEDRP